MSAHLYLVALGSNRAHPAIGLPRAVLRAATDAVASELGEVERVAPLIDSAPVGPSLRRYANGALLVRSESEPSAMLDGLQAIEARFGRRRRGQRWGSRVLDLDIVAWSGGIVAEPRLAIPHPLFRKRDFVLGPVAAIAPTWRDPVSGLTMRQLHARLTRPTPLPR